MSLYRRDAFSHSEQCNTFYSFTASGGRGFCGLPNIWIDLFDLPPVRQLVNVFKHDKCRCWCHNAEHLFTSPEPEYDFTPPPEYLSSADRAFVLDEPAHVRVGFSEFSVVPIESALGETDTDDADFSVTLEWDANSGAGLVPAGQLAQPVASRTGFANWSREELQIGKCGTCGDKLADCECVE